MKKLITLLSIALCLSACVAHPTYGSKAQCEGWLKNDGDRESYIWAYTLPNTRHGLSKGFDIGHEIPFVPLTGIIGAVVGTAVGVVEDVLNMIPGALSVAIINPMYDCKKDKDD